MTRRLSLFITIVGTALVLGVPTAGAVGVPTAGSIDETTAVYPDWFERAAIRAQLSPDAVAVSPDWFERAAAVAIQNQKHEAMLNARKRGLGVYPDSYKRTAVVGQPDPRHASIARHRALEAQRAPFPGSRGAPSTTVEEPRSAPVATSSSNELAWSQIGIGLGIGIVLMLGLYLLVRGTRQRQLAH